MLSLKPSKVAFGVGSLFQCLNFGSTRPVNVSWYQFANVLVEAAPDGIQ